MIVSKISLFIRENGIIEENENVLIALSGGPDSMALLHVLKELSKDLSITLEVLHINHHMRGAESDEDALFCQNQAEQLGIPFHLRELDEKKIPSSNKEEWMRNERRKIYKQFLSTSYHHVALGHTMDDLVENFFLRLFRGSGIEGLKAMSPVTDERIIRPLLCIRRFEIMEFLHSKKIPYRIDKSNEDTNYRRNLIRKKVIPYLSKEMGNKVVDLVARASENLYRDFKALQGEALIYVNKICDLDENELTFNEGEFKKIPLQMRIPVIREMIRIIKGDLRKLEQKHYFQTLDAIDKGNSGIQIQLPGPVYIEKSCNAVLISKKRPVCKRYLYKMRIPGSIHIPETGEFFNVKSSESKITGKSLILPNSLNELIFRNFSPGDRIKTSGGTKKLKKYFLEKGVPSFRRSFITLVCNNKGAIIWIPEIDYALCYNENKEGLSTFTLSRERNGK